MVSIPDPESITAEFLTAQLVAAGHDVKVESFVGARVGTGQIGMCIRYDMTLSGPGTSNAPQTLIAKFPSDDPQSRATGVQLQNYIKEVSFYRELESRLDIRTPKCYYADIDGHGPDFALLLEDMTPAEQGDQLQGCGAELAQAAVLELVGLHAPSWRDESLCGVDWIGEPDSASAQMIRGLYQGVLDGFFGRFGDQLTEAQRDIITRFGESDLLGSPLGEHYSLVHIDYRLDNLLIDSSHSPPTVTVVDWQTIALGNPMTDVAYFIGAGMLPQARRQHEQAIVRRSHEQLTGRGIEYDWATCWCDYQKATFAGLAVTVIASMMVQQTDRGDTMFATMARRHSQHAIDLGASEYL